VLEWREFFVCLGEEAMWGSLGVNVKDFVGAAFENVQKLSQDLEAEMNAAVTNEVEQNKIKPENEQPSKSPETIPLVREDIIIPIAVEFPSNTSGVEKKLKKNPKKITQRLPSEEPPPTFPSILETPQSQYSLPTPPLPPPPPSDSYVMIEKEKISEVVEPPPQIIPKSNPSVDITIDQQQSPHKSAAKVRPKRIRKTKENSDPCLVQTAVIVPSPPAEEEIVIVNQELEKIPQQEQQQPDSPLVSSINHIGSPNQVKQDEPISESVIITHKNCEETMETPSSCSPPPLPLPPLDIVDSVITTLPSILLPEKTKIVQFYESKVEESNKHYFERRIESLNSEITQLTLQNDLLLKEKDNFEKLILEKEQLFKIANMKLSSQMKEEMNQLTEVISERERALQTANIQLSDLHQQQEEMREKLTRCLTELNESKQQIKQYQNSALGEIECKKEMMKLQEILKEKEERLEAYAGEGQALSKKQVCSGPLHVGLIPFLSLSSVCLIGRNGKEYEKD
jgi:hypothetical protein